MRPPFPRHRPAAFTLVELVCTLAIIAGLLTFAAWNYRSQAQRQRGRTCGVNLQLIEDAKAKFRVDFPGTPIPESQEAADGLRRYFAGGQFPKCPAGGTYTGTTSSTAVCRCSLNVTNRFGGLLAGSIQGGTAAELASAQFAAVADPDDGGDRSANGFHDVGYPVPEPVDPTASETPGGGSGPR